MKFVTVLLIAICSLAYAAQADAQNFAADGSGLDISASTASPAPGQSVTLTLRGYGISIGSSNVTWSSGGTVLGKGIGLDTIDVTAPAAGKRLTVDVTAVSADGMSDVGSITLGSGSVDLIIEPDGYVPPFFPGKAPIAYENSIKITAVPHLSNSAGVEYDPKTLVYDWRQSSSVLQDQSGYGAQSITLAGSPVPRSYTVTVTVSTRDGSSSVTGLIAVNPGAPSILLYRNDTLYGPLFERAIGDNLFLGSQRETGVIAVPLGFNISGQSGLSFNWLINNISRPELASNRSITLRAPDNEAGSSNVRLTLRNARNMLQQAQAGFTTRWGAAGNSTSTISF